MDDFHNEGSKNGFFMKLWRGERMCLLGFDVVNPEPDLVGFAIECRSPGSGQFYPLRNRLSFSYAQPPEVAVDGSRKFISTESPFQKFRWVHFPFEPKDGAYTYRATKMHMPSDKKPVRGTSIELDISLAPVTYDGFLDVGFTRNFASSQAYRERYTDKGLAIPIPAEGDKGLDFAKLTGTDVYSWLGFEAYDLLFGFLDAAIADPTIQVDALAYDLNEPDILAKLELLKGRLRAIVDDSTTKDKSGKVKGHGTAGSPESKSAARLKASAGAARVKRTHFQNLQHHKVFIARRNGVPFKVLAGSTNFTFRGLYIQANNLLVFQDPGVAALFGQMFDIAFQDPGGFKNDPIASKWHLVKPDGKPAVHLCFSPHKSFNLSLNPVRGAVDQADSSVFYSMAFLNLIKSGPTKEAFDRLVKRPIFSYGVLDKAGSLEVRKPDGSKGVVDFAYLAENAPEPFKSEWQGGKGINIHHKFVVTDFNLPTAKVFAGSSNLAPAGESKNGDHLIMIEDRKVATGYAIEALRMFDHLHFRTNMRDAKKAKKEDKKKKKKPLTLHKPTAISGEPAWFEPYYVKDSQKERDRKLFAS